MSKTTLLALGIAVLFALPQAGAESGQMVLPTSLNPVYREVPRGPDTTLLQSPNQTNGIFSDIGCGACATGVQIIGENFVVSTAGLGYNLDEISIWGGYYPGNVPTAAPFDIYITTNSGGLPGATVCSALAVTPTSDTLTGVTLFGVSEHLIVLTIPPCSLTDGTYWLYLFTNTGAGDDFFWEVGNLDGTNGVLGSLWATVNPPTTWNIDTDTDVAVHITGTIVPVELQSFGIE
jgi:hypothetical protein